MQAGVIAPAATGMQVATTAGVGALALLALCAIAAVLAAGSRKRPSPIAPRVRAGLPRLQSQTAGIPRDTIDDYGSRRLARGSTAPPMRATLGTVALRPQMRPLTPVRVDELWDLSERDA